MTATARRAGLLAALLLGAAGIAFFFRIELTSGFAAAKGPNVDARQAHWMLEWVFHCVSGDPLCKDLWTAPYFHPARATLTYGDSTLGPGLLYAGMRAAGAPPAVGFALTQVVALALCFGAALWMLAGPLRLPAAPAALGAYLFAFGAPVAAQVDHPHLFARFPVPLLLGALLVLLEETEPRRRRIAWALAAGAWALQAWFNLNLLWLASFVTVCLAIAALALPGTRRALAGAVRTDGIAALASAAFAIAAVFPLLRRMIEAQRLLGGARELTQWYDFTPQPESWINVGAQNWIWGPLAAWPPIRDLPYSWEHELGIGLVTTVCCLAGVWLGRRRPALQALFLGSALAGLLALRWPGGFTLWRTIHEIWPGAESVRALGRLSLVLLAPAAIALALALTRLRDARGRIAFGLLAAVVLLEQQRGFGAVDVAPAEERATQLAALVPADCPSFYWSPRWSPMNLPATVTQVDAMFAALESGKPTVNGYASYAPPGWYGLNEQIVDSPVRRAQLHDNLAFWALHAGAPKDEICWVLTRQGATGFELVRVRRVDPALSPWPDTLPGGSRASR